MSARVLFTRTAPLARRRLYNVRPVTRRPYPLGAYSLHNVPATRPISFVRVLPKLVQKFATLGAAGAGATIAGLVYIQNQATAAGNWVADVFNTAKDGATNVAGEAYEGASSTFDQIRRGWQRTKDKVEMPEWMRNIMEGKEEPEGGQGSGGPESPKQAGAGVAAVGGATAAAFGVSEESDQDERSEERIARDEQMMMLTKKMIHIRSLLQTVGQSESLTLPSIVVIGSQSSGKSSVLEAIVGHEFLPKGNNMVTRRPIELTLVNTPEANAEYGEFPAQGLGKITDFGHIQKILTDLNLAVPPKDCVSDDPIQLRIYSPNVPDLSLIDLPGYIQVTSSEQPPELKQKIAELCERYIQPPNVILAISAADVDLANSTSLRASRKVDPRGERTIGVITKMDLVDPHRGVDLLTDKKYPLRLGYVGVVCKMPQAIPKLFHRGSGTNMTNAIVKNEAAYFSSHPEEFGAESHLDVGTTNLRKKLMHVLEQTMAASLKTTSEAIHQELAEATYEFKVQYNERPLSAETYLAESLDAFKHSFRGFAESFGREQIRELLKHELDQQVLNLLAQRYWNKPINDMSPSIPETDPLEGLPKADPEHPLWHLKLDASTASLTKLGIGRLATTVIANALQAHVDRLVAASTFSAHPFARQAITEASSNILRDLNYDISDELEICVKPYKYRIELDDKEWSQGRDNVAKVLKEELRVCEQAIKYVEEQVSGRRKLRDVMAFIDRIRNGQVVLDGDGVGGAGGFSAALLKKGKHEIFHWLGMDRANEIYRTRCGVPTGPRRYYQDAANGCQVEAVRAEEEQILLSRGILGCRCGQVDNHCGSIP